MQNIRWKWNVPNVLSLLRLALVPVIVVAYLKSIENPKLLYVAVGALVLSGLTDAVDGFVARHFNQMTEIGKLLDPLADKLTQMSLVVCVTVRNLELLPLLLICVIKEMCQLAGGILMLGRGITIRGAKWYGKLSTLVFYTLMTALVLFPNMPLLWQYVLVGIVAVFMLMAFFNYFRLFIEYNRHPEQADAAEQTEKTDIPERNSL